MHLTSTSSITSRENIMTVTPLLKGQYQVEIHHSITDTATKWAVIAPSDNTFLQVSYFQCLEAHPPKGITFKYLVFLKNQQIIGIAHCQLVQMKVGESLINKDLPSYQQKINALILKAANMNALIYGNLSLTGNYGRYFIDGISEDLQCQLVKEALEAVKTKLQAANHPISLLIFKDIEDSQKNSTKKVLGKSYNEFSFQPNMTMELPTEWTSFDDYLAALQSKSRMRAKRAFKKSKTLVKKEFTIELLQAFLPRIDYLYKCIADKAGFNLVYLDGQYFLNVKEHFPEQFRVFGYFLEDELIAFYTTFHNHEELEAHYLGLDAAYNRSHQVYLNILFDIIRVGIDTPVKKINFARTALEIKSSVGAKPEALHYFGKHTNPIKNQVFSPILAYFQPKVEWTPRNPFKSKVQEK